MYFRSKFVEISKVTHFWKACNIWKIEIDVTICVEAPMAAIFEFQNGRQNTHKSDDISAYTSPIGILFDFLHS